MHTHMSTAESLVIGGLALAAWAWLAWGPQIKVWASRPPRSWDRRNFWS